MHRRAHPAQGFTLIELLVVIGIISVLALALLPNVIGASVEGERAETQARIDFLAMAAKAYERPRGYYPPDNFVDSKTGKIEGKDNNVNSGIESLVLFLCKQRIGQDSVADHEDWLANTDSDENSVESPLLQRRAQVEVCDAWGVPLLYARAIGDGYTRAHRIQKPEGTQVTVRAHKNPETGRAAGSDFQIVSAGPDGEFGTEDDITYPKTR